MKADTIDHKNIFYPPGGILLWIIIYLELITFGAALVVFVLNSKSQPEIFHNSRLQLNSIIGLCNTIFLLTSGFFMATSVHHFKLNDKQKTSTYLKLTMLGGLFFIGLKSFEYYQKLEAGITSNTNIFFTYYWFLTIFHFLHVIVGLIILTIIYVGLNKKNSTTELLDLESGAAFWHMCDLIWLMLFPILYLIL